MQSIDKIKDKMLGCLYGQAIGNALGIHTEFMTKKDIQNMYSDGISLYPYDKGDWEDDDTKQMLCILDELNENSSIIPSSLAYRLENWLETDGRGCGNLVYQVIRHRDFLKDPFKAAYERWNLCNREAAPNGGIMRTSVIGLMSDNIESNAIAACKVTHYDPRCIGSCVIVSQIIHSLVWDKRQLTYENINQLAKKFDDRIEEWIDLAYNGNLSDLKLEGPEGIGYTLRTFAAALWAYFHAPDFKTGLLAIVNEGGDADTNAAIACAILGAKFGYSSIPPYYVENLQNRAMYHQKITSFINKVIDEKA